MCNLILVNLEIVLILTQDSLRFVVKVPYSHKSFRTHLMELLSDIGPMESRFGPFGDGVSIDVR
jgi:hypothetical protein